MGQPILYLGGGCFWVSLLFKEEAAKLRVAHHCQAALGGLLPTPWWPASSCLADWTPHRDKTLSPRVEAVVSRLAHTGAKASPSQFSAGRVGGVENRREVQRMIRDGF